MKLSGKSVTSLSVYLVGFLAVTLFRLFLKQVRQLVSHVGLEVTYLKRVSACTLESCFDCHYDYLPKKACYSSDLCTCVVWCALPMCTNHEHYPCTSCHVA